MHTHLCLPTYFLNSSEPQNLPIITFAVRYHLPHKGWNPEEIELTLDTNLRTIIIYSHVLESYLFFCNNSAVLNCEYGSEYVHTLSEHVVKKPQT